MACGKEDKLMKYHREFDSILSEKQVAHSFQKTDGAHTMMTFRRHFHDFVQLLFK